MPRATLATPEQITVPYNIDAEEAVVGSILIDGECVSKVSSMLLPDDFFSDNTRHVYQTMIGMNESQLPINQMTVAEALHTQQRSFGGVVTSLLEQVGGIGYLIGLTASTPTSLDIEYYAGIVKKCAFYRGMIVCASQIAALAYAQDTNTGLSLDKAQNMLQELRNKATLTNRSLVLGEPRLIQTHPPLYIWNVNGKDLRLNLSEITQWGKFKNRVISELNFVPIQPKDWDNTLNKLLTASRQIEAPIDASEEEQLKIYILKWFGKMREAQVYSDLAIGRHVIREFDGQPYYCFQSTPLITKLTSDHIKGVASNTLWMSVAKWGGIRRSVRVKKDDNGSMSSNLWCIPMDFVNDAPKIDVPTDF